MDTPFCGWSGHRKKCLPLDPTITSKWYLHQEVGFWSPRSNWTIWSMIWSMRHLECKQGHWVSCHPECHWPHISGYKLPSLYFQLLAAGMAWGHTRSEEWNFYLPFHSNKNIFSKRVQEPDKAARCENQLVHVQPYTIEDTSTPRMSTGTRTISAGSFSPMLLHANQKLPTNKNGHAAKTWAACCRFSCWNPNPMPISSGT
jgi:hypothetical protein